MNRQIEHSLSPTHLSCVPRECLFSGWEEDRISWATFMHPTLIPDTGLRDKEMELLIWAEMISTDNSEWEALAVLFS
jgi:hypothetical protein